MTPTGVFFHTFADVTGQMGRLCQRGHGLLRDDALSAPAGSGMPRGMLDPAQREKLLAIVRRVKELADERGVSLSQLALAWSLAKYDHVQSLIGTTSPEHLHDAIDALNIDLTAEDIARIEAALPAEKIGGRGMRNFVFTDGVMSLAR